MNDLSNSPQGKPRRRPARGKPQSGAPRETRSQNKARRAIAREPLTTGPFAEMGVHALINANIVALGLTEPTPIQRESIPATLAGRDILGLAQTGTGKTAAFGLPILTKLLDRPSRPGAGRVRALILAPTRELATQIFTNIDAYSEGTPLRSQRVVGGASLNRQSEALGRGADILVATPGRLIDLLERRAVSLQDTEYLVLDEADQMLDIGFIHALRKIARLLPEKRQTLMFSATMPKLMEELASTYLSNPVRVQVNPPGQAAEKISQGVHFVNQGDKAKTLADYMSDHTQEHAIVFGRTKYGCEKLSKLLEKWGFAVGAIHGNKSQGQRERALAAFRAGDIKVLVATDVAARGIDVPQVAHVYNYDLPNVPENYVHRIGRTARAGRDGRAIAFCAPGEIKELRAIEALLGNKIPVIAGEAPAEPERASRSNRGGRPAGGRHGSGRPGGQGGRPAGGDVPRRRPSGARPQKRG